MRLPDYEKKDPDLMMQAKRPKLVSIQGELGSNSHMAVRAMLPEATVLPAASSAAALDLVESGVADGVTLPIENSLHGSVVDHYDLLLTRPLRMVLELNLRVQHQVIGRPGTTLEELRRVLSHPVALSQCRRWLAAHPAIDAVTFYDTAGSVKHVMEGGVRDAAGIAPALAAEVYGGEILVRNIEDHPENYTRFHLIVSQEQAASWAAGREANKMSLAFAVEHRPGSLVAALARIAKEGADLTKIESRPVPGRPWEYLFYVDLRFARAEVADAVILTLGSCCRMVQELGRYPAAT